MCFNLGGGTSAQTHVAAPQNQLFQTMASEYDQVFADNMAILNNLTSALEPIIKGGPEQFGFSPEETAALRTMATERAGQTYAQTSTAVERQMAARGGGNVYVPSGVQSAVEAGIATQAEQELSREQLGITEAGYQTGRQNFWKATGALAEAPGALERPAAEFGRTASDVGKEAFGELTQLASEQGSLLGLVGGLAGTAASFIPGVGPFISAGIKTATGASNTWPSWGTGGSTSDAGIYDFGYGTAGASGWQGFSPTASYT